jgi:hypothetical protein
VNIDRITRRNSPAFVLVAAATRQGQIVRYGLAAHAPRIDVIDVEGIGRVASLAPAVFAAMASAISHESAKLGGNSFVRHYRGNECRVDPTAPVS